MGKGKRKKIVTNDIRPTSKVTSNSPPSNKSNDLIFDFTYHKWLQSVKIKKSFTNMLKDDSQFAEHIIQVFSKIIPVVSANWDRIKNNGAGQFFPHCHTIKNSEKELVNEIIEHIYGKKFLDDENDEMNYWQLGISQGLRLIAIYNHFTNTMYPVFLDYHHQIFPSVKHNQDDIWSFDHCPYISYC